MRGKEFIKDKAINLFIISLAVLITAVFMNFMGVEFPVIVLVEVVFCIGYMGGLLAEFFRKRAYYNELLETMEEMEEKTYLTEVIKEPYFYDGRLLYRVVRENGKYMNDMIADLQKQNMEYSHYVETWVHEVKTPIAVSKLLIENNQNEITMSLLEEIDKVEQFVEQMLYYTKGENLEQDYYIQEIVLEDVVRNVVKKYAKMIITSGMHPQLADLNLTVLSDAKWLEFVIGQVVSNAVKYQSKERASEIVFQGIAKGNTAILSIHDNGIGIASQDVGRVFQKGFTGENGRIYKKSTGMGLYLCKRLCEKMGIHITLTSEKGRGTTIELEIPHV